VEHPLAFGWTCILRPCDCVPTHSSPT
jgi:hypothetical protein